MVVKEALNAVYDDDLEDLLKSLGLHRRFLAGQLRCAFCGDVITWENLHTVFPDGGDVKVGCTRPTCVVQLVEKVNGRTS